MSQQFPQYPQEPYSQYPQGFAPPQRPTQPPPQYYPPQQQTLPPGYYQQPQPIFVPVPQPRKSRAPWVVIGVLGAIGLIMAFCSLMAALGSHSAPTTVNNVTIPATVDLGVSSGGKSAPTPASGANANPPTTNSGSTTDNNGNTIAHLGQTITADDVSCTVTKAAALQSDGFITPKSGMHFVVVHVKLSNTGTAEKDYGPYDFHAKSSSGNITDEEYPPSTYASNNLLDSGKLAPGGKVEGDIVFQIPVGDAGAEVTWSPSFFDTSSQYAWTLGVK